MHPKPLSAPLASLGGTWFQIAWRISRAARRQAPSKTSATQFRLAGPTLPLGTTRVQWPLSLFWDSIAWRRGTSRQAPYQ